MRFPWSLPSASLQQPFDHRNFIRWHRLGHRCTGWDTSARGLGLAFKLPRTRHRDTGGWHARSGNLTGEVTANGNCPIRFTAACPTHTRKGTGPLHSSLAAQLSKATALCPHPHKRATPLAYRPQPFRHFSAHFHPQPDTSNPAQATRYGFQRDKAVWGVD